MDTALVLLNMGGVSNQKELSMFLTNMFNDKNILTIKSDFLRSIIANLIVFLRKKKAWEGYELVGGKSPLNLLTKKLLLDLQAKLPDIYVTCAMRYLSPSSAQCVEELDNKQIKNVILFPLYPQYSTTTVKSSVEAFEKEANGRFNIVTVDPFYYITQFHDIITNAISFLILGKTHLEYDLIFSAHGLPKRVITAGDPYQKQLEEQVELLTDRFLYHGIRFRSINLAYQSKVGPLKWIEPSLEDCLQKFKGRKVIIYPISFIVDNIETFYELSIEYKKIAKEIGVKEFYVCECPNYHKDFIDLIIGLSSKYLSDTEKLVEGKGTH